MADEIASTLFHVGEVVHIVEQPVQMPMAWVPLMSGHCGERAVIRSAYIELINGTEEDCYRIEGCGWIWNNEAFQEFYEEQITEEEFFDILNG